MERVDFVNELFLLKGQNQLTKHGVANTFNSFGLNPMGLIMPFNVAPSFRRYRVPTPRKCCVTVKILISVRTGPPRCSHSSLAGGGAD